jgi:hypothetical protein
MSQPHTSQHPRCKGSLALHVRRIASAFLGSRSNYYHLDLSGSHVLCMLPCFLSVLHSNLSVAF